MSGMVWSYAPNTVQTKDTDNTTNWFVLATDGTGYASLAALAAAGKKPYPSLDPGMFLQTLTLRSESSTAGTDGGTFYYALNQATQPASTAVGELVSASGQTIVITGPVNNLWLKKTNATDSINVIAKY